MQPIPDTLRIHVPVWDKYLFVVYSRDAYVKLMRGKFKIEDVNEKTLGYGATSELIHSRGGRDFVIGIFDNSYNTLVHECVHCAGMILNYSGVKAGYDNDEPLAYLTEFIYAKASRLLAKRLVTK